MEVKHSKIHEMDITVELKVHLKQGHFRETCIDQYKLRGLTCITSDTSYSLKWGSYKWS